MTTIMNTVELSAILAQIMKSTYMFPHEQQTIARYWWTRYCTENMIYPDTKDYDDLILCIWSTFFAKHSAKASWFSSFEEFDMYMCERLV